MLSLSAGAKSMLTADKTPCKNAGVFCIEYDLFAPLRGATLVTVDKDRNLLSKIRSLCRGEILPDNKDRSLD
jgi:hypothetical protein